ncbi:hypothetical protein CYMTET_53587 [Cymbomonas tetramitiformis]|uniref:Uncharacterized protein n=1 Tax=Cymbomonas tetramitiformis TaxID=36881 RepID=A0AAE0BGJ4_9CHLO|nr:hypothetical protein CYMTET_53587 [Cymbomonas tetramitiformis]
MKGKHQKVRVLRWTEDANSLWSDHGGESAESLSTSVRLLQLVIASGKERDNLLRWFTKGPRTRHGQVKLYSATGENLQNMRGRYRSSSDGSEERSRGRRRLKKKKKKSKKSKKQRKATAEEQGKAVATKKSHPLTPEMAVKTLFKDKALRYQAFECLPEERQMAIAKAVAAGEEMCWE